ncbi:hypothetical protein ABMY26_07405 (plasmid) [Azospirillum sp. HJ39]|uniref:hypothetical protein n=1 Tax=Azospirillum sp. HJ39 TaxID=3159496 RepID=UPI003556B02E
MSEQFAPVITVPKADTVTVPTQVAPFAISETYLVSRVNLGSFGILQFDSMLIRVDATGALRRRIAAALNADPALATAIQQAAFSPADKP